MLENHVGVRKLAAQTALPLFQRVFASHLESGNTVKGAEHDGKGTSWTLAPIYRLEAGVIKQPPSGIQMRNLVCNPRTQQMTMFASLWFSDLIKVAPFDPLWGTVSADGGSFIRLWPNVDTKQWRFSLSFWEDVDFQKGTQTLAHQTEQNSTEETLVKVWWLVGGCERIFCEVTLIREEK